MGTLLHYGLSHHTFAYIECIIVVLLCRTMLLNFFVEGAKRGVSLLSFADELAKYTDIIEYIARMIGAALLYGIVILLVLVMLGIDVIPFVIGAGFMGVIASIAITFVGQYYIKNFLTFLCIRRKQCGIGEDVEISGQRGMVESIDIDVLSLRKTDGELITIPMNLLGMTALVNHTRTRAAQAKEDLHPT